MYSLAPVLITVSVLLINVALYIVDAKLVDVPMQVMAIVTTCSVLIIVLMPFWPLLDIIAKQG